MEQFSTQDRRDELEKMLKNARLEANIENTKALIKGFQDDIERNKDNENWIYRTARIKAIKMYELEIMKYQIELENKI